MIGLNLIAISSLTMITLLLTSSIAVFFGIVDGQSPACDNGELIPSPSSHALPVILLHGYREASSEWSNWEQYLDLDGIQYCTVSFHPDDICGTASHNANELSQIVQKVKIMTLQNEVNIAAHSKGGLDARLYLAKSGTDDVANLIMIGTPNAGSPFADSAEFYNLDPFCPAIHDLTKHAYVTNTAENINTRYYTIAGVCYPFIYLPLGNIREPNDGLVGVSSVQSQDYFHNLGHSPNCHNQLLGSYEYGLAYSILSYRR